MPSVTFPNTAQTRFRIASISKPITAVAILQLQAAGKLVVDESVCQYLPDCPTAWQAVTLHHLLTHTSGIPNYTDFANFAEVELSPVTPRQLVESVSVTSRSILCRGVRTVTAIPTMSFWA
ncbi:MAG: hypothetical protein KatS3mg056_1870 [Chloroflexus sp.]|nr:MAG: hypothetical protein KatS3mg056_1870 [Chloroflexus sp.]